MNLRTSLLLLVVVATFGGLWLATSGGARWQSSQAAGVEPLFPSSPLAVRVERGDGGYLLRREGGFWTQVSPVWGPLSEEAGRRVARALAGAVIQEKFLPGEGGVTLADLALDESPAAVEVVGENGIVRVALGESTPGGFSYGYVEESSDADLLHRIVTLPEGLHHFVFDRQESDWFDERLALPELSAVVDMSIAQGTAWPNELIRGEDGRWRTLIDNAPVRPEIIAKMTALGEGLLVREFLGATAASAGPGVFGLRTPSAVWTLTEANGRTTSLMVGRSGGLGDDSVYGQLERRDGDITLSSPILRLPPLVSFLAIDREGLVDPRVFPFAADRSESVQRIAIAGDRDDPEDGGNPALDLVFRPKREAADPEAIRIRDTLLSLTGERRLLLPERLYPQGDFGDLAAGGIDAGEPGTIGQKPSRPRGFVGTIVVEHGLADRTELQILRRRGDWVLRQIHAEDRVDFELDEESEDRFDEVILPHLSAAPSEAG